MSPEQKTPTAADQPAPTPQPRSMGKGLSFLLTAASIVLIADGIKAAQGIITPILAAAFIAMIAILPLTLLQHKLRLPRWLALVVVLGVTIGGTLGIGYYLGNSARTLGPELPMYETRLNELILEALNAAKARGADLDVDRIMASLHSWKISDFAEVIFKALAAVLQNFFFVLMVSAFIIAEASALPVKMATAFPSISKDGALTGVADKIRSFLVVVTQLNVLQAAINWIACAILGVPFAFMLSFFVFFFNYIPTIGAIIASGLVIAITLVAKGWGAAIGMTVVQVVAGVVVGSIMQPRMLGSRLGLSPLVVLLSLVVWGYLLGFAGMFFAVPLTIIMKIVLDSTDDLRWLSVLLGDAAGAKSARE